MRLIDADAVLQRLKGNIVLGATEIAFLRNYVNSCPTVDAVKVVHCKDCKYWINSRQNTGRCNALIWFHDAERYLTACEHFCSYGERKDNATD